MAILRFSLKIILCVVFFILFSIVLLSMMHESLGKLSNKFVSSAPLGTDDVFVRYMGNTNLLFSDGDTNLLIDGWFTRPSLTELTFGLIEPDMSAIDQAFERGSIDNIAAVIPLHSHFDHAMDSPEVALRTGAQLLGSMSTANIGKGWGLSEEQIEVIEPNKQYRFGRFQVTLIPSKHFEFPNSSVAEALLEEIEITKPLVPPVKAADYKMGGAFTVYIQHPSGNIVVQGSAGFIPNALDELEADVVFLGIGGLSSQTESYRKAYWQHTVKAVGPSKVYPIHWDSLTDSLEEKPVMPNLIFSKLLKFSSTSSLNHAFSSSEADGVDIGLLPMWKNVGLF